MILSTLSMVQADQNDRRELIRIDEAPSRLLLGRTAKEKKRNNHNVVSSSERWRRHKKNEESKDTQLTKECARQWYHEHVAIACFMREELDALANSFTGYTKVSRDYPKALEVLKQFWRIEMDNKRDELVDADWNAVIVRLKEDAVVSESGFLFLS